jgi:hypothetical protein
MLNRFSTCLRIDKNIPGRMSGIIHTYRIIGSKGWYLISLSLLLLIYSSHGSAQEVKLRARIDSSSLLIGDQTLLHLEVIHPPDISIQVESFKDTLSDGIEILQQNEFDTTITDDNMIRLKKEFLITSFDSGQHIIPPIKAYAEDSFLIATYKSNPLMLNVSRPAVQPADSTQQIFDIKMPYSAPVTFGEVFPYILIVLALAGLAYFVSLLIRKRRKDEPVIRKIKPTEPAHVIALRELDHLKTEKLWQKDKVKLYYSRLTEIMRTYLENRYGILAMEQTSNETLQSLLDIGFNDNNLYEKLKEIFYLADLAKFAKAKPLASENETAMLSSYVFVQDTREAWKKEIDKLEKKVDDGEEEEKETTLDTVETNG